jgi:hypothetical protein
MRPPRRRTQRIQLRNPALLSAITLNVTALLVVIVIVRIAALLAGDVSETLIPYYAHFLTEPAAWPLKQLPVLSTIIAGDVHIADLFLLPAVLVIGLLVSGIIRGWGESERPRVHDHQLRAP